MPSTTALVVATFSTGLGDALNRGGKEPQVQLRHGQHGVHRRGGARRVRVTHELLHALGHDLPRDPEAVGQPPTLARCAAIGEPVPQVVDSADVKGKS